MTSLPLEQLALGEAGRRHVRLRLEQARSLSRSVLAALPDGTGDPTAIVPAATELERALRFEEGGLLRTDVSRRALESILDPPMASPGAVFVAEDPLRRCSDPALARERTSLSCFHDEVYWW